MNDRHDMRTIPPEPKSTGLETASGRSLAPPKKRKGWTTTDEMERAVRDRPDFRMVAGPNGTGKTTLWRWLDHAHVVNFYTSINTDDMFAEAVASGHLRAPLPVDRASLERFLATSDNPGEEQRPSLERLVALVGDSCQFVDGTPMRFLAEYGKGTVLRLAVPRKSVPDWFRRCVPETEPTSGGH